MPTILNHTAAQPWADRKRVLVSFDWEGDGPVDVEVTLLSPAGEVWARMLIVELRENRMDVTLHSRRALPPGSEGVARIRLLREDVEIDGRSVPFALPFVTAG